MRKSQEVTNERVPDPIKVLPTLVVLQKYAAALGKNVELKICDGARNNLDRETMISLSYHQISLMIIYNVIYKCD